MLDGCTADRIEGEGPGAKEDLADSLENVEETVRSCCVVGPLTEEVADVSCFVSGILRM